MEYRLRGTVINGLHTGSAGELEPLPDDGAAAQCVRMLSNQRFVPMLNRMENFWQIPIVFR